jgi:hypothetical protein
MDFISVLDPIDPWVVAGGEPSRGQTPEPIAEVTDLTLVLASEEALRPVKRSAMELIADKVPQEPGKGSSEKLAGGQWTHTWS